MQRGLPLDEHDLAFLLSDGIVTDPFGDDAHLSLSEFNGVVLHLDSQMALQDEEQFVFMVVTVPSQRSLKFGDLDVDIVDLGHDPR